MTTVNVTHVKGCVEDLEIGEGTVQQIRNGRPITLTKLGAASIPWSQDPVTGMFISIRTYLEGLEAELAAGVTAAKYWAEQASTIVTNGVIDDSITSLVKTWSSGKLSDALADKADKDVAFYVNSKIVTKSFTIPTGQNAMSIGPNINFVPSAVITVEIGAAWTII
jgi:heme/copper-type cytochrome/quinol oxidase subunit 2